MKKLTAVVIVVACVFLLSGCGDKYTEQQEPSKQNSMFIVIENQVGSYRVVYHKDTRVMYAVSYGASNCGTFTLLVNPDGTPMIYEEASE